MNLPSNVMKNILDFCGEPLPKNGEEDDRELTKWIRTPEGTAYYKIDDLKGLNPLTPSSVSSPCALRFLFACFQINAN